MRGMQALQLAVNNTQKSAVSTAEWEARVAAAAAHRLADHYGWSNLIYNHIAVRIPDEPDAFLFKAHNLMFGEVTASNLLKVRLDGRHHSEVKGVQAAGYTIHSAILAARADINCTIHIHTPAGIAMSAHGKGLKSLNQGSMRFHNRLSYHDYEGIADSPEECERLVNDLGASNMAMIMRHHGLLTCGQTVSEAISHMRYLDLSCDVQLRLESAGAGILEAPDEVCEKTAQQWAKYVRSNDAVDWAAYLRIADRLDPSYAG